MSIAENLALVTQKVQTALTQRAASVIGTGTGVKLVAVTKNQDITAVRTVIDAGAMAIGENRVQEALSKSAELARPVEWHLIGHLQTNKVRQAVPLFDLIHSVDSERLALEIDHVAGKIGKRQDILLQVNVAEEDTKFGLQSGAVFALAKFVSGLEHVRLCGLMTMAPFFGDVESTRPVFRELYNQFMELRAAELPDTNIQWLSMGMSNDFTVAIEEGANLVRVGTALFGPRHY